MSNWNYVVVAYAVTWTAIIGYALVSSALIRRARRQLLTAGEAS